MTSPFEYDLRLTGDSDDNNGFLSLSSTPRSSSRSNGDVTHQSIRPKFKIFITYLKMLCFSCVADSLGVAAFRGADGLHLGLSGGPSGT